jgi:hypothetical protein
LHYFLVLHVGMILQLEWVPSGLKLIRLLIFLVDLTKQKNIYTFVPIKMEVRRS